MDEPKVNTNTYNNKHEHVRTEKLLTLAEFIQFGRLKPGQKIMIGEVGREKTGLKREFSTNTETFWVGHATEYHSPSDNDGGFGWNFESDICKKYVIEVTEH